MIDGGWTEDAMAVKDIIKSQGGIVDAWILTHPHQDHIGAFNEIYAELKKDIIQDPSARGKTLFSCFFFSPYI